MNKELFSNQEVNTSRQIEMDLAKGFAILFMVWTHTNGGFGGSNGILSTIVDEIFGGPFAAPVFMVCMGVGMCYSKHTEIKDLVKRGINLLFIGYVLNVFRSVIPHYLSFLMTKQAYYLDNISSIFSGDIMQFAGFAFLFFALVKKWKWSDKKLILFSIFSSFLGMLLVGKTTGNECLDLMLGNIWATDGETFFPFLNWIIFPTFGYLFGKKFRCCKDKESFYKKVSPLSGLIGFVYIVLMFVFKIGLYSEQARYYFLGPIDAIAILFLVIGIFGLDYYLSKSKNGFVRILCNLSENINTVYCIHWTIIGLLGVVMYGVIVRGGLSIPLMTLLAIGIVTISGLLAQWYSKYKFMQNQKVKLFLALLLFVAIVLGFVIRP